jgi:SAM-dependent methyltransferase
MEAGLTILDAGPSLNEFLSEAITDIAGTEPVKVLEAGCGHKWPISTNGTALHITGVDLDPEALRIRQDTVGDLDVGIVADLHTVDLPADSFDVVYSSFVLEHIPGAEPVLDRLVDATRPGGRLIIRIPDGQSVFGWATKHSPHRVHVWYHRYGLRERNAGKPGHAPYPTYYDPIVSRQGMIDYADRRGLHVIAMYGTDIYLMKIPAARFVARWGMRFVAWCSRGRLTATHNNLAVVLEKPTAR